MTTRLIDMLAALVVPTCICVPAALVTGVAVPTTLPLNTGSTFYEAVGSEANAAARDSASAAGLKRGVRFGACAGAWVWLAWKEKLEMVARRMENLPVMRDIKAA